ncbi:MAG: phosphoadenosine phosphosulfate reductase family protein [Clostridia bacterium]|nr:phosphoadenosine phosphosulfate reductase family protein [Clostridia bacterium]
MTIQELEARQKWTLNQKIDHAVGTVEAFIAKTGKTPYVSFSGGKDSTVLLDLVRRFVDKDIKAVFCNTGNEYPEIVRFVRSTENVTIIRPEITFKQVISRYGFPLISKEQAHGIRQAKTTKSEKLLSIRLHGSDPKKGYRSGKIADRWQFLIKERFDVSEQCCEYLKKRPFARYSRETGEVPILGVMAGESDLRKQQYIRRGGCNSFQNSHIASYPISIWTDADIWEYLRKYNVPYCELYDKDHTRTGCMFCGFGAHLEKVSRFELLYDLHPRAYNKFMDYENNGCTYREALRKIGVLLPDECRQLNLFDNQ